MAILRGHPWVRERQRGIGWGLQVGVISTDPDVSARVLAAGRLAEELGFDAFFLGDHPAYSPDAWLHLGALAVQTERIRLGSVVLCAAYRAPMVTARLGADLDNLSGGRFILGLGHGWNAGEFAQLSLPFPPVPERQAALAETIEIINGVWGPESFTYQGRFHATERGQILPSPRQGPRPPLLLAGAGERTALRLVARYADACNFGPGHATGLVRNAEEVRRKNEILDRLCREAGRDPGEVLRTHFTSWIMVAPTREAAEAKLARYYPTGLNEEQRHSRVVGTPTEVAAYYQSLVEAGMRYFVVQIQDVTDIETIELVAHEVAPLVTLQRG